jgi:hypothetical protein
MSTKKLGKNQENAVGMPDRSSRQKGKRIGGEIYAQKITSASTNWLYSCWLNPSRSL